MLGAARVELLGWLDSGTVGDAAAGSLVAADRADVEAARETGDQAEFEEIALSLAGAAARQATGTPRRAPGWADWPGTDLPGAPKQTARRRPPVHRAETELR